MELLTKASWSDEVTQREKDNLQVAYLAACESIVMLKTMVRCLLKAGRLPSMAPVCP